MDIQMSLTEELNELETKLRLDRDAVIRHCMQQSRNVSDPETWERLDADKKDQLRKLESNYAIQESELRQQHCGSQNLTTLHDQQARHAAPQLPSRPILASKQEAADLRFDINQVPLHGHGDLTAEDVNRKDIVNHMKRKASVDLAAEAKRPSAGSELLLNIEGVIIPNRTPAPDILPSAATPSKQITYQEVRRRATEEGHWDTIVEFPRGASHYFVLYCEEHEIHFRENAVAAAAKHLNSSAHNFPDRHQRPALAELGYCIVDCSAELQKAHNDDVKLAFRSGYVPGNKLAKFGKKVKYPFEKTAASTDQDGTFPAHNEPETWKPLAGITTPRACAGVAKTLSYTQTDLPPPKTKATAPKRLITNPKPFYIYNCFYPEEAGDDIVDTIWPVMILGWDDLRPGLAPFVRLADTPLFHEGCTLPKCYTYSEENDRIIGWASGYEDGSNPAKIKKRKFPVMFFDSNERSNNSYGWLLADELQRFPIDRKAAPKIKGYKERAFNAARNFIAEREGFDCWQDRDNARLQGQLTPWYPVIPQSSPGPSMRRYHGCARPNQLPNSNLRQGKANIGNIHGDHDVQPSEDYGVKDSNYDSVSEGNFDALDLRGSAARRLIRTDSLEPVRNESPKPSGIVSTKQKSPVATTLKDTTSPNTDKTEARASSTPVGTDAMLSKMTAKRSVLPKKRASLPPNAPGQVCGELGAHSRGATSHAAAPGEPQRGVRQSTGTSHQSSAPLVPIPSVPTPPMPPPPVSTPSAPGHPIQPATTPEVPAKAPVEATAVETPQEPHDFEIISYEDETMGLHWERSSPDESGIKLFKRDSGQFLQSQGQEVDVEIDPAIWGRLHFHSARENSVITVSDVADADQKIKMVFGRRESDETISAGKMQARKFVDWLRKQRVAMGHQKPIVSFTTA